MRLGIRDPTAPHRLSRMMAQDNRDIAARRKSAQLNRVRWYLSEQYRERHFNP
jgi:hypothetical protein